MGTDALAALDMRRRIAARLRLLGVRREELRDQLPEELTLEGTYQAEAAFLWDYLDELVLLLAHQDLQIDELRREVQALRDRADESGG